MTEQLILNVKVILLLLKPSTINKTSSFFFCYLITSFHISLGHPIHRDLRCPIINSIKVMAHHPENVIHVSGFGPFRGFTNSNPSWEAVSKLPDHIVHNNKPIPIVKHEVPVTYAAVDEKVQEIWTSKPKLVIHCGVSKSADKICLEQNAYNGNFRETDFVGQVPPNCNVTLPNGGTECKTLCTSFNLNDIINDTDSFSTIKCSNHPGDYLCGYIYLKSLDVDRKRSLFIHVPPPSDNLNIAQIRDGILSVITHCVSQLGNNH